MANIALSRILAAATLFSFVFAGCAAPADPTTSPTTSDSGAGQSAANATVLHPPSPTGAANATGPVTFHVAWNGSIGTHACLPSGPNACTFAPAGNSGDDQSLIGQLDNGTWHGKILLQWTSATPLTETLALIVAASASCGPGCESHEALASIQGQSPVELWLPPTRTNATVVIVVTVPAKAPPPVYMDVAVEQTFTVQGELRVES